MQIEIEELKSRYLDLEFDRKDFQIDPDKVATVAKMSGETLPQFCDKEHPDFQAPPAFIASLVSPSAPAGGLPEDRRGAHGRGQSGYGGTAPVRPGTSLTGKTHLHDIYDKSGPFRAG